MLRDTLDHFALMHLFANRTTGTFRSSGKEHGVIREGAKPSPVSDEANRRRL